MEFSEKSSGTTKCQVKTASRLNRRAKRRTAEKIQVKAEKNRAKLDKATLHKTSHHQIRLRKNYWTHHAAILSGGGWAR